MSLNSLREDLETVDGIIDESNRLDGYLDVYDYDDFIDLLDKIKSNIIYKLNKEELEALHNIN